MHYCTHDDDDDDFQDDMKWKCNGELLGGEGKKINIVEIEQFKTRLA